MTTTPPDEGSRGTVSSARPGLDAGGRIPQIDGLRGVAVGLVLVWHYFVCVPGAEASSLASFLRRLFFLGWSGVDLFFVLSGFLIGGILLDNRDSPRYFRTFYLRRAFRILPVYLILLLPYWSAYQSLDTRRDEVLQHLLGGEVPAWSYGLFVQNVFMVTRADFGAAWLGVTWSLAIEEQFYLVLPLTLYWLPRRFVPRLCLVLAVLALALRMALTLGSNGASAKAAAYVLLPSRMDALFLGLLGAWLVREPRWSRVCAGPAWWLWPLLGAMAAVLLAAALRETAFTAPLMGTLGYSWLAVFYLALLLAALASRRGALHALLTWRPLRALGQGSYFVYLFHVPVLTLVHYLALGQLPLHHARAGALATLAALALLFGLAALSWRHLEQPLLEQGRKARY